MWFIIVWGRLRSYLASLIWFVLDKKDIGYSRLIKACETSGHSNSLRHVVDLYRSFKQYQIYWAHSAPVSMVWKSFFSASFSIDVSDNHPPYLIHFMTLHLSFLFLFYYIVRTAWVFYGVCDVLWFNQFSFIIQHGSPGCNTSKVQGDGSLVW